MAFAQYAIPPRAQIAENAVVASASAMIEMVMRQYAGSAPMPVCFATRQLLKKPNERIILQIADRN